jgi:hypothetical protein
MPRRPLPHIPRGPRRLGRPRRPPDDRLLFACPRVSPEWEFATLGALMKPTEGRRGALEHRTADQPWPPGAHQILAGAADTIRARLNVQVELHYPGAGEYHALAHFPPQHLPAARALALICSRRLPDLWFTLDRLFVHAGVFHRRRFGYKLTLVPATDVHLPRDVRAALNGAIPPCPTSSRKASARATATS